MCTGMDNQKRKRMETAILAVYVIVLASSVQGRKTAVDEMTYMIDVMESGTVEGEETDGTEEEDNLDEVQWIYEKVKEIDFSVREYPIETSVYNEELDKEYKEAFYQVISNQVPLSYDDEYYDVLYFKNILRGHFTDDEFMDCLREKAAYWYMDYDGDGLPELVVEPWGDGVYVFKYDQGEKNVKIISSASVGYHLMGAGQYYYENKTSIGYYGYMYIWKDSQGNRQRVYFDVCFDTDLMWKLKGIEENLGDIYYIRYNDLNDIEVSKEMWEELTEGYFAAIEEIPEASSYDDIFGNVTHR